MIKNFVILVLVVLLVLAVLYHYVRVFERNSIFFPSRNMDQTPVIVGLDYEDVYFETADGVMLNGWFLPARGEARGTMLFCHGNAGNISHRLEQLRTLHNLGVNVFIFDYRGYGRSKGIPSEQGTYKDAEAAYKYIEGRTDIEKDKIIIYGRSLGGGVAVDLAHKGYGRLLISDSAFTSTKDMARIVYPMIPLEAVITFEYDSRSKIKDIELPKLIVHSKDDEIVPFSHGKTLYESAAPPKEMYVSRGGHNEGVIENQKGFAEALDSFLKQNGI